MRRRPGAITALLALGAAGLACGGGGGHDTTTVVIRSSFPQGFLPVLAGTGRGDVALRIDGDLYFVDGSDDVRSVSRVDGGVTVHAVAYTPAVSPALLSITPGSGNDASLFAGDDQGRIWEIASDVSTAKLYFDDAGMRQPITGLAFASSGFGGFGDDLFAAAGTAGVLRIFGDPPRAFERRDDSTNKYVDLAFSGATLFAIDPDRGVVDSIDADKKVTAFRTGFGRPVGLAIDTLANEIYVADAAQGVISTVPLAGGAITKRAPYSFSTNPPSGIAWDGLAALVFVTTSPNAIRGSFVPRINPDSTNFPAVISGTTVGYGDLEFDRTGTFVLVANAPASKQNFLFSAPRDVSGLATLQSGIFDTEGQADEQQLLSLAIDPKTQTIYIGTDLGNLYQRTSDGTFSRLIEAPAGAPAILGLEVPPKGFCAFDPCLVATLDADPDANPAVPGKVIEIDPANPNQPQRVFRTDPNARFSDLVFAANGTLFVVDCDDQDPPVGSHVLEFDPAGSLVGTPLLVDGRVDGVEIDEGGKRLLVTRVTAGSDELSEITLPNLHLSGAQVHKLANIDIDDGYFPTGVVYDRLGTVVHRRGNDVSSLGAVDVKP